MRLPFALLCLTASPVIAQDYPFIGSWSCEVADFTFTADTYQPGEGSDVLTIASILDTRDGNFEITMTDGYFIGVSMMDDGTMGWLSGETGDMFACVPLN